MTRPTIIGGVAFIIAAGLYLLWHFCDMPTIFNAACGK
jgi:hypothetical protein